MYTSAVSSLHYAYSFFLFSISSSQSSTASKTSTCLTSFPSPPTLITHDRPIIRQRRWWWSHLLRERITKSICVSAKESFSLLQAVQSQPRYNSARARQHMRRSIAGCFGKCSPRCAALLFLSSGGRHARRKPRAAITGENEVGKMGRELIAPCWFIAHTPAMTDRPEALQHAGV